MNWRGLFYFSKGERRALTLLLVLITLSWLTLQLNERPADGEAPAAATEADSSARGFASTPTPVAGNRDRPSPTAPARRPAHTPAPWPRKEPRKAAPSSGKRYVRTEKLAQGTRVELNTADTTVLKKVPGIGSTFARRIVRYRELLGGFYTVAQLAEVYGIDQERYEALRPWFTAERSHLRRLRVNHLPVEELERHPYISFRQARAIAQLVKQKGRIAGWENLHLLEEFGPADRERLSPYLSFED